MSWRLLALVGIGVAVWAALAIPAPATRAGQVTADEPQYLLTAISLGEDRNLDISDELAVERWRDFHANRQLPVQTEVQEDGTQVSPHDPLLPALLAFPVLVGGWAGGKASLALVAGGLAATLLWIAVVRFAVPQKVAVVTVLAFAASAPLVMYGTQVYPELPAALAVALAVAAITGALDRRGVWLAGAAIVALPWLSVKYVPVAVALTVCLVLRKRSPAVLASLALMGAVYLLAHHAWYGGWTVYSTGDHFVGGEFTVVGNDPNYWGRAIRLAGLMLDRDFGLAAWQPAYLLLVPAALALLLERPRGWIVLALPFAAGWLNATFVAFTMHGWWWPGRQTVVILPCVVVAIAWWAATRPIAVRTLAALGVFGASVYAWLIAESVFGDLKTVVTFEDITHPLLRAWHFVLPGYRDLAARDWALHAMWLIALIGFVAATVWPRLSIERRRIQGATTR